MSDDYTEHGGFSGHGDIYDDYARFNAENFTEHLRYVEENEHERRREYGGWAKLATPLKEKAIEELHEALHEAENAQTEAELRIAALVAALLEVLPYLRSSEQAPPELLARVLGALLIC